MREISCKPTFFLGGVSWLIQQTFELMECWELKSPSRWYQHTWGILWLLRRSVLEFPWFDRNLQWFLAYSSRRRMGIPCSWRIPRQLPMMGIRRLLLTIPFQPCPFQLHWSSSWFIPIQPWRKFLIYRLSTLPKCRAGRWGQRWNQWAWLREHRFWQW